MWTLTFQLQLDVDMIDFGTTVIGETLKRSFTLSNRGALGTKFDFFKVTGESVDGPFTSKISSSSPGTTFKQSVQYTKIVCQHMSLQPWTVWLASPFSDSVCVNVCVCV